jgi:hypothetical protein
MTSPSFRRFHVSQPSALRGWPGPTWCWAGDFRKWHNSDLTECPLFDRFWGQSGHRVAIDASSPV